MDEYKVAIFSRFVASPPPVNNTDLYFLFLYFYSLYVSTIMYFYEILDGELPVPQC